jgi:hypothetical protein
VYCHTKVQTCIVENEQQFDNRSVLDRQLTDVQRGNITLHFEDVKRCQKRRSVEDHSVKRPDLTFY